LGNVVILNIGIDDTDSKDGMCTTYVGALIVDKLTRKGARLVDLPRLIRLNPNWKLKTRGNCSIALKIEVEEREVPGVKKIVLGTVEELAELNHDTTNPGVVFYEGIKIPKELREFSKKVVQDVVTIEDAEALAKALGAEVHKFKLGRGIIGALAAIGNTLEHDWTFELIAYRLKDNWGTPRRVDEESVPEMDAKTYPNTFDNVDPATGEIRITPHTPCPILYGIRAESIDAALGAHELVRSLEPIERIVVFKTNQGTDEHVRPAKVSEVKPNWSVIVDAVVCRRPMVMAGGHVIFRVRDGTGEIDCAAYEPTRQFRDVIRRLVVGDRVIACGGVKEKPELPLTINLEKLAVIELKPVLKKVNPKCPTCGKRMKSEGKGKGYSCKRCRIRLPAGSAKIVDVPRNIEVGEFEVPPRARRHLAKPLIRTRLTERVADD
jgi:tRNA(Ile2)-agmatinylcytidine synthase